MITIARFTKLSSRVGLASFRPATTCTRQVDDIRQLFFTHQHRKQNALTNDAVIKNSHTTVGSSIFWNKRRDDDDSNDDKIGNIRKGKYSPGEQLLSSQTRQPQLSQRRIYHTTAASERAAAIIMGLTTISALGFAGSSAIKSYKEWKASQPTKEELDEMRSQEEKGREQQRQKEQEHHEKNQKYAAEGDQPRKNIFREWFDVGNKYYEGGFEDTMTRREAALILGVRESASPARVKDAHRNLLILNHPDTGGSTFLAGKLNEAKELLLKGKSQRKK